MSRHGLTRLRVAAAKVSADLTRAGDEAWACSVGRQRELVLRGPWGRACADLRSEIDEGWFLHETFSREQHEDALSRNAEELVAGRVVDLLRERDIAWPRCPHHGAPVQASEGFWICTTDAPHDLAPIGRLSQDAPGAGH